MQCLPHAARIQMLLHVFNLEMVAEGPCEHTYNATSAIMLDPKPLTAALGSGRLARPCLRGRSSPEMREPGSNHDAIEIRPRCNRNATEMQSRSNRDAIKMQVD